MLLYCCHLGCYNVAVLLLQCTVTCGRGHKTRQVTCVDALGHVVPDVECGDNKPKSYRKCRKGRCPRWITKAWSKVLHVYRISQWYWYYLVLKVSWDCALWWLLLFPCQEVLSLFDWLHLLALWCFVISSSAFPINNCYRLSYVSYSDPQIFWVLNLVVFYSVLWRAVRASGGVKWSVSGTSTAR